MPLAANPAGAYLGAPLVKATTADKTGTHYDFNGIGGYFGVPTLADLYTIACDPSQLNEDGFSSGQRRLSMRVRIMTTADRGREFVLDVDNYETLTQTQQLAALCNDANFVEQPRSGGVLDLTSITGDVTFLNGIASIGAGKVTGDKISPAFKDPAANVQGLRSLGTGATQAAPGTALANKVDKLTGYGLSQQNFTASEKSKLSTLPTNPVQKVGYAGNTFSPDSTGLVTLPTPDVLRKTNNTYLFASAPDNTIGENDDVWISPDLTKGTTSFYKKINNKWELVGVPVGGGSTTPTTPATPLSIVFNSPGSGANITAGTQVTLTTTVTTATGTTIVSVEFYNATTGELLGTGLKNGNRYSLPYTPQTVGSLPVEARVTDSTGATSDASVAITVVTPAAPSAPLDLTVDNTARTATFTPAAGKSASDYEFQFIPTP